MNLRRGTPGKLPPPIGDPAHRWSPEEAFVLQQTLSAAVVGGPEAVRRGLEAFCAAHQPDELMIASQIYDHHARLRSFEILADVRDADRAAPALGSAA